MDFASLKQKAIDMWKKAVDMWVEKLSESSFTINTKEQLEEFIKTSKTTSFTTESWEEKFYKHKSLAIFADEKSEFFKELLYMFPVLLTKSFSQNMKIKLVKTSTEGLVLADYKVTEIPSLVIFEEEKYLKTIASKENILKLVKSLDLDINKQIENIS